MNPPQLAALLYFRFVLPVFGGLAAVYGGYELVDLSFFVALLAGGLFGYAAHKLAPLCLTGASWPEVLGSVGLATPVIAFQPLAFGVTFALVERNGSFPAIVAAGLAAVASYFIALVALPGLGQVARSLGPRRGEMAGGLMGEIQHEHLEAQKRRRG